MTIFDKLSGFAHKAKENALSRAILSKDKRLDKSMSESLDAASIGLSKMSSFGIPGRVSAVAYDPVSSLLAVGGGVEPDTYIRVFGKGISTSITLSSASRIKYLKFQTGSPTLVAVDTKNIVTTYDLKTKRARGVVATPSIVTSLEHCVGTDWLFIGFADGNVDMFDMEAGAFGEEYGIPNLCLDSYEDQKSQQNQQPPHNVVVSIQMHPTDLDLVLVGYDSAVFLWSIRDQNIKKCFKLPQRSKEEIRLTCLAWSPCGSRFMAGYDNGYMHLWDMRNDNRSLMSRRVFHAGSTTEDNPCEPIYQMAWYVDDNASKSFLVVAGGSDLPDIRGLHVMEYDLNTNDPRDARKQTILSTPIDVADFILLSSEPYFLGMHNPLGLLVVGVDGGIRAYGLDHGHPPLILPPALQFLDPPVEQAYYISQLPHSVFQQLIAPPAQHQHQHQPQQRDLYLPLAGGVAGNGHIYRIPSNDLLLTVHGQSTLRFWDASYTSLRPLSNRTIYCSDDISTQVEQQQQAVTTSKIRQVVLDNHTGGVIVNMNDNTILVYIPDSLEEKQPAGHYSTTQEKFIANCEDTLDEISQLLEDMNNNDEEPPTDNTGQQPDTTLSPSSQPEQQQATNTQQSDSEQNNTKENLGEEGSISKDETNPFISPEQQQAEKSAVKQEESNPSDSSIQQEQQVVEEPTIPQKEKNPNVKIELLDKRNETSGFTLTMKISLEEGTITKMVSGEKSLFGFSTSNASTYVIDRLLGQIVFSINTKGDNYAVTPASGSDANSISTENSGGKETSDKSSPSIIPEDTHITQLGLYSSYSPSNLKSFQTVPQLFIGLSNGHTYQHDITTPSLQPILIPSTLSTTPIIDIHMIDINGNYPPKAETTPTDAPTETSSLSMDQHQQSTEQLARKSSDSGRQQSKDDAASVKSENSNKGGGAVGLLRKTTRKFSKSANRNRSNSQSAPPPPLPQQQDMPPLPTEDTDEVVNSPTSATSSSKRITAGRWEYNEQPNPHFLIIVSKKSMTTFLSGYNTRLFQIDLQSTQGCTEQDTIISSKIMTADGGGSCLTVVLQNGTIIFYTLPHLTPLAKINIPADIVASRRLEDMSYSGDGRIVMWSGAYELEQDLVLLQSKIPHGEAVMLHNPSIRLPPHPIQASVAQKSKKSWLDTVQGAFQKGPLTVAEFDTIMGKKPKIDPETRKSQIAKAQAASSSGGGGSNRSSTGNKVQEESSGVGGVFKELGVKMNERGERLNELETKFEDMNQASGDFLKAVRDYNERQANKKWWEF
ncbi:hypothetical protein BDC45DRAFT_491747 [Circinella umbellata]|nr:hypothetical protein BDC45DRAFT_491747 [Circinella umbellata]